VLGSGPCDRGAASSRPRAVFDFTNRTGIIEYDLDGSRHGGQRWFLFLTPADRKRDLSGHAALPIPTQADPPFLLRITKSDVQLTNADGQVIHLKDINNMYINDACGPDPALSYCPGENLESIPNVRRHFRIELSKTHIKMFVNDILVIDGSLITDFTPNGLPFEVAQVNWIFHSYDTKKRNLPIAMLHWDNFGFDAPAGWQATEVIHNYTDGHLGSNIAGTVHHASNGMVTTTANPAQSVIPIPDSITDQNGNMPIKAELMFTLQVGNYQWNSSDFISINNQSYPFEQPVSSINNLPLNGLVNSTVPYSALVPINPADLLTGNNMIQYNLSNAKILNVHIELTYPINAAPAYTQPAAIYNDHMTKLMEFTPHTQIGPNLTFPTVNGLNTQWPCLFPMVYDDVNGYRFLEMQMPVSGLLEFDVTATSDAQLASKGIATGISHYNVYIDEQVVQTVYTNAQEPVSYFQHTGLSFDTHLLSNGTHYLYVEAYDVYNRPSVHDLFLSSVTHGEYLPIAFTVNNTECATDLVSTDLTANSSGWNLISFDVSPADKTIQNVFADIIQAGNLEFITAFDNGAKVFDPNLPPAFNTLQEIEDGFGYWVKVTNTDVLQVEGACLDNNFRKPFDAGWNLVAYPPDVPQSPATYFTNLICNGELEFVTGFDEGTLTFDPNLPVLFNTLQQMENGFGYWVKVFNPSAKTANPLTNVFNFIYGTSNLPVGEKVKILNEAGEAIAVLDVIEGSYLMTTPIYGDDKATAFKEYVSIGENLRFSWDNQIANFITTFKGDYEVEKIDIEFKLSDDFVNEVEVKVYPVPAKDVLNFEIIVTEKTDLLVQIFDTKGSLVRSIDKAWLHAGKQVINYNVEHLAVGIYTYQLITGNQLSAGKFNVVR